MEGQKTILGASAGKVGGSEGGSEARKRGLSVGAGGQVQLPLELAYSGLEAFMPKV